MKKQRVKEDEKSLSELISEYVENDENKFLDVLTELGNIASGKASREWRTIYVNLDVMLRTIV